MNIGSKVMLKDGSSIVCGIVVELLDGKATVEWDDSLYCGA
ncbi:hypothetical protein LCGC14_2966510, partial [marine sediment metagenome]